MIVVTGGEGFIGKNLIAELERRGNIGIVCLDTKSESLDSIFDWLLIHALDIDCIYHLGAITDTMEMNINKFDEYNVNATIFIWNLCFGFNIPLVYASSAATYGDGEQGFDDEKNIIKLQPLNPYGWSKQQFDVWAETQEHQPKHWYGLKFFNVYGHGEKDKGKMASVVLHLYDQIQYCSSPPKIQLFKSHRPDYKDGEQKRDFVYVDDVVDVCIFMATEKPMSGIYNVGTGKARTFNDLAGAVFNSLGYEKKITYIDTPIKLRDKYQYFTEAKINKLRVAGYKKPFHELEEGVSKYINKLKNETC
jgi:ADP-L-glycero-D-manno-heptose 6-epimerase